MLEEGGRYVFFRNMNMDSSPAPQEPAQPLVLRRETETVIKTF